MNTLISTIDGVIFKPLVSHKDDRGFFREIIRNTDDVYGGEFGQWSHSRMAKNTVKAWHYHAKQTDWWYLASGLANVVLFDLRQESPTFNTKLPFLMGDCSLDPAANEVVVRIPPGVAHGCRVESESADLFYITSRCYDPNDEGRYPYDSDRIPHSWENGQELIVSERDRIRFEPR